MDKVMDRNKILAKQIIIEADYKTRLTQLAIPSSWVPSIMEIFLPSPCAASFQALSHFGDVSEMNSNGRETFSDHVTRNASAASNNEA